VLTPKNLLLQQHTSHTIEYRGSRVILEVHNILVASRLIDSGEPMQSEVERLTVLNDGLVERRKKHITLVIALTNGANHQAVILSGVATNDGGAHIATRSVGRKHLALKRILEVAQTVFVEC
jgi:hypothetical protein